MPSRSPKANVKSLFTSVSQVVVVTKKINAREQFNSVLLSIAVYGS